MYTFSSPPRRRGRNFLIQFKFLYLSMLRYCVMLSDTNRITHCKTTLRWLLRRGSPLPIPNRVVKPACADGTAVMWESMSSPFFKNPSSFDEGFFVYKMVSPEKAIRKKYRSRTKVGYCANNLVNLNRKKSTFLTPLN